MDNYDPMPLLFDLFAALRRHKRSLGIRELLEGVRAAQVIGVQTADGLADLLRRLWSHSLEEARTFDMVLSSLNQANAPESVQKAPAPGPPVGQDLLEPERAGRGPAKPHELPKSVPSEWTALPVRAPFLSGQVERAARLDSYWPVSRRYLAYAWRYLHRPLADGPADVLDINATVERVAREGFFLAPVYRRRVRNQAQLLMLVDQDGSMVPFHGLTRELIETATQESGLEQVSVYYFHNFFAETVYTDPLLSERVPVRDLHARCDEETSVVIVSDAGAARGFRKIERISQTAEFLGHLQLRTRLLAWLNPMPQERWEGSSAQMTSRLVRMFQMDPDGCSAALDVMRGMS